MSFFRLQLDCCLHDILIDYRALPKSRLELKHAAVTARLQVTIDSQYLDEETNSSSF